MSTFREIEEALHYHLRNIHSDNGYSITTQMDINTDALPVIYYNGNKDSGNWFAGSLIVRKDLAGRMGDFVLTCPEFGTVYYHAMPAGDGRYVVTLSPEIVSHVHGGHSVPTYEA